MLCQKCPYLVFDNILSSVIITNYKAMAAWLFANNGVAWCVIKTEAKCFLFNQDVCIQSEDFVQPWYMRIRMCMATCCMCIQSGAHRIYCDNIYNHAIYL